MPHPTDAPTRYSAVKFGSPRARPKIVGVYKGIGGWTPPPNPAERLARPVAERLRSEGYTLIRVRHRFRTHEVSLLRYLGG
ncbi:hypothetical protein ACEXQB_007655 [Herbiconiux sp. P18]|uniref:hypothetical protein n=1 Tax=Herbiconiux liangxiaofengii TaxID=3342795 RepID=UPI0035B9C039